MPECQHQRYLYILDEILAYEVDQIETVMPEDTEILNVEEGKDYVTLVTCTPYGVNTQRLLVRGHRVPYVEEQEKEQERQAKRSIHTNYLAWIFIGIIATNSSLDYKETVVQAVMEYINSDCQNANLTKIAEDTHQSMTVLSKLMKQKTGYTFQELLQRKRFQKAVYLLVETELTVEDIALEVGYENQSYFYRQFQKRYGMTPKKYRDLHKKDVHIRI